MWAILSLCGAPPLWSLLACRHGHNLCSAILQLMDAQGSWTLALGLLFRQICLAADECTEVYDNVTCVSLHSIPIFLWVNDFAPLGSISW